MHLFLLFSLQSKSQRKDFKNYQTVEEATNAINNLDNITPAQKAAAIKNIEDGGHGANIPTTDGKFVPFQVVENNK